jgi:hypothetical protein
MVVQAVLIITIAWLLSRYVWTGPANASAVRTSAWVAFAVQAITFSIARLVARQNMIAGWGLGVVLRFATVAIWAFLGTRAMGLPAGPALISLAIFLFVSSLIEPIFLNR